MVRFHTQTGGSTLTAQQPENNIIRVALQGFAAVCGGTQSLHTNGFDEALGLPTEYSARIALRTQQVLAHESGAADTVDPFAGSYYVERLTADIENEARALMAKVEELGGSVEAIEAGFIQREIEESAFAYHRRIQTKQDVLVGVNEYAEGGGEVEVDILKIDPQTERDQVERLRRFKEDRDQELVRKRLDDLRAVAEGDGNLLYPIKDALRDHATIGEVCTVMRDVFGEYKPPV
jgi:methylmalonyl-CoA mutase N-terminal domain/subunit